MECRRCKKVEFDWFIDGPIISCGVYDILNFGYLIVKLNANRYLTCSTPVLRDIELLI